jgi:hypothetical protein
MPIHRFTETPFTVSPALPLGKKPHTNYPKIIHRLLTVFQLANFSKSHYVVF